MAAVIPRRSFYASSEASTSSVSIEGLSSRSQTFQGQTARQRSKQRQLSDDSACEDASSTESSNNVEVDCIPENNEPLQVVVCKTMSGFKDEAKSSKDIARAVQAAYPRYRRGTLERLAFDIERVFSRQPCFVKDFLPDGTRVWTLIPDVAFLSQKELRAKVALKQALELRKVLTSDQSGKIFARSTSQAVSKKYALDREAEDATSLDQLLDWTRMWKPHFEWRILISCAILGSQRRMLRVGDIVKAIDAKYRYRNVTVATIQKCLNKRPRFYSLKDKNGIVWWRVDTEIPGSYLHTWKTKGKLACTIESQLQANASTYGRRLVSIPTTYALPLDSIEQEIAAQASYYAWKNARCANRAAYVDLQCAPKRFGEGDSQKISHADLVQPEIEGSTDKAVIEDGREVDEASDSNAPSMAFSSDEADASSMESEADQTIATTLGKRRQPEEEDVSTSNASSPYTKVKRRFDYIRSALYRITG